MPPGSAGGPRTPRRGRAGSPPIPERHPLCAPVTDFDIIDERYVRLRTAPDVVPLAAHEHEGEVHPLLWARVLGRSRVVTDALGHDERSYDSAAHRELISRAAQWLTRAL